MALSTPTELLTPVLPVKEIENALVLPAGLAMKGWRLIPESTFWDLPHDRAYRQRYAWYKRLTLKKAPEKIPEAILIHHPWASNMVFWFGECLPRLLHVPNYTEIPVLAPKDSWSFIPESLKILGIHRIIWVEKPYLYRVDRLYLPTMPMRSSWGSYYPYIQRVREAIRSAYDADALPSTPQRIYLSRAYANHRKILNEDELMPILEKFGFVRVFAEKLPFSEQVRLFSRAEVLLGMHGAGHAHLFWMPTGSWVVEIVSASHLPPLATYANLSRLFGHQHAYLPAPTAPESLRDISAWANVILPPQQLESFLRRIL